MSDPAEARPAADDATPDDVTIRRAAPSDAQGIGDAWLTSWRATFDFPPAHPDHEVRAWLAEHMVPTHETWVAATPEDRVVGLLALSDDMLEQLYLDPAWIGRGLGTRLVAHAKARRPAGLELYCFAANDRARRFYERHGFVPVAFGDGTGNEEGQPDVRYAWRP